MSRSDEILFAKEKIYMHWEKINTVLLNIILYGIFFIFIGKSHSVIEITGSEYNIHRIYNFKVNNYDELKKLLLDKYPDTSTPNDDSEFNSL